MVFEMSVAMRKQMRSTNAKIAVTHTQQLLSAGQKCRIASV